LIEAKTVLSTDELDSNDSETKLVKSLLSKDVGVTNIIDPSSGAGLGSETITVEITNFGGEAATNIALQYTIDGGTPVVETFMGTIAPEETSTYSFTALADLSVLGTTYLIESKTDFTGDLQESNDAFSKKVTHTACTPQADLGCNLDGIKRFVLNTINVDDGGNGCNNEGESNVNGYADRTDLSTVLFNAEGNNEYILQAQHNWQDGAGVEVISVWIDFNDNFTFEPSEQLISGEFFQSFGVLEDFNLVIPTDANIGKHILRVKVIDSSGQGDVNDPCGNFSYGEVHDYSVEIDNVLSVDEQEFNKAELVVLTKPEKRFEVTLTAQNSLEGTVYIGVYNMLGQQLKTKSLTRVGNDYKINLNMAQAQSGVYFLKVGDLKSRVVKTVKIMVQ